MISSAFEQQPRLTSLAGADRLVRLSVGTYEWMRDTALRVHADPPADRLHDELRTAELLDPERPDELLLEPHWAQLLRRALNSPVRIDMVSVDGDRAWTTTIHVAGQMLLVLDQGREISRRDGTLELGRRSSALTLAVGRIQRLSDVVIGLAPQRPAFGAENLDPVPAELVDAPAVAEVQVLISAQLGSNDPGVRERSWYALGEQGQQLAALASKGEGRRLDPAPVGRFAEFLRADLVAAIQKVSAADGTTRSDAGRTDADERTDADDRSDADDRTDASDRSDGDRTDGGRSDADEVTR